MAAMMQEIKAVAIAEEARRFRQAIDAISDRVAVELIDLKPDLMTIGACDIAAIALAHDLRFVNFTIEFDARGNRKCRRQRPPLAPRRRVAVARIEQQCRQRHIRWHLAARRKQFVAVLPDESGGRLTRRERGMTQARREKRLIGGDAERDGVLKPVDEP